MMREIRFGDIWGVVASALMLAAFAGIAAAAEKEPAKVLQVAIDGSAEYSSINAAIEAAAAGACVKIGPGVYKEQVKIDKPVVLQGAGWEQTTILYEKPAPDSRDEMLAELAEELKGAKTDEEQTLVNEKIHRLISSPVLKVSDAHGVELRDVKITLAGPQAKGGLPPISSVEVEKAGVTMRDCAIVGSLGNGIHILGGSDVSIKDCLVAAVWSTGIVIGTKDGGKVTVRVEDCDVRNCHYAGIRITKNSDVWVERCRISGAAWHGIRYDDASPTIADSLIFKNARCGIYASGETAASIRGNVFYANEMDGISCWFQNRDTIEGNVFVKNLREGLAIVDAADPLIRQNIFFGHPAAIVVGFSNNEPEGKKLAENRRLEENIFWENEKLGSISRGQMGKAEDISLAADSSNVIAEPMFESVESLNFSLRKDSPGAKAGIGVKKHISFHSPWALQPEELAMIPDRDTRDSRQWKR